MRPHLISMQLQSIRKSECPKEFQLADKRAEVHLNLTRKEESYTVSQCLNVGFLFLLVFYLHLTSVV